MELIKRLALVLISSIARSKKGVNFESGKYLPVIKAGQKLPDLRFKEDIRETGKPGIVGELTARLRTWSKTWQDSADIIRLYT